MLCNNCGQNMPDGSSLCNNCRTKIEEKNIQNSNKDKKKILGIIILVIIIISIVAIIGTLLITRNISKEVSPNNSNMGNKVGKVELVKSHEDFKQYSISIEENAWTGKHDFKIGNHIVTMELYLEDMTNKMAKVYVDNKYIFDDSFNEDDEEKLFKEGIILNTLGDYIILDNHDCEGTKCSFIYIIDKDGNNLKKIYELDSKGIIMTNFNNVENIDSSGITIYGSISSGNNIAGYIDLPTETEINLCDQSEWPEYFNDDYIYSSTYKFSYENGVLDLEGKIIESTTVGQVLAEYEQSNYCSIE